VVAPQHWTDRIVEQEATLLQSRIPPDLDMLDAGLLQPSDDIDDRRLRVQLFRQAGPRLLWIVVGLRRAGLIEVQQDVGRAAGAGLQIYCVRMAGSAQNMFRPDLSLLTRERSPP
jgi:hypothetical protein